MVNIILLTVSFLTATLLIEFGVNSMKSIRLGESSKISKVSKLKNWVKGSSSSKEKPKKKILLLADKFSTHYNFAVNNLLK